MNEKIYKTMSHAGATNLALGITIMITGIVSGVLLILHGARLLQNKKHIIF